MIRRGVIKWATLLGVLVASAALARCSGGDGPEGPTRLVVFVEATDQSSLNQTIEQKYLRPIYFHLVSIGRPFDLTIFPISANSEAETPLLRFSQPEEWMTEDDINDLADAFRELRQRYARIYPPGSSYLVDVLGTAMLLDSHLGANAATDVLYLSDMIQQEDISGYDFTEYARGKSLEQCREELEERLGPNLRHRNLFAHARVHIVYIGVDALRRGGGGSRAESGAVTRNVDRIKAFWKRDFFGGFLRVREVQEYPGSVEDALKKILPPV